MLKTIIKEKIEEVLVDLQISDVDYSIEKPAFMAHGDYSTNVALIASKKVGISPRELAVKIKEKLESENWTIEQVDKIEIAGPGFINFWIAKSELLKNLNNLQNENEGLLKGKKIMVEFAHPNTHKALHIGHLRNISTGESLVRLFESQGAKVIRANYQGDVGMHIAKAMYGLLDLSPFKEQLDSVSGIQERVEYLGKAYAAGSLAYENDLAAKEKIHDYNYLVYASAQKFQQERGLPAGTTDYLNFVKGKKEEFDKVFSVWKETRQWSLDYYEMMYKRLNTHFDRYYFESECLSGVDMARVAVKKGVLRESEGAIIFDGTPYGLDTRVFVNSLGLPTYEAKELALATKELNEFGNLDKIIHVVGPEQASFFTITFKAEELLGIQKDQQHHLSYGWVRLKHGKMSSRLGNVITAEQLLNEVKSAIEEILIKSGSKTADEKTAEQIAVAAIKYSFLKVSTTQEIAFDLQDSVSAEGNSGPYLQYTYARTRSVLDKATETSYGLKVASFKLELEEEILLRMLYFFKETVSDAANKYSPSILCNYLYQLAQQFNLFYQKHQILNAEAEKRDFRLSLTAIFGSTIKSGLNLLGIQTPEKM